MSSYCIFNILKIFRFSERKKQKEKEESPPASSSYYKRAMDSTSSYSSSYNNHRVTESPSSSSSNITQVNSGINYFFVLIQNCFRELMEANQVMVQMEMMKPPLPNLVLTTIVPIPDTPVM